MHKLTISDRQFDHIIAALRYFQRDIQLCDGQCTDDDIRLIATEHGELMTPEEIDSFIQEINK
jgi:hypothetical protein